MVGATSALKQADVMTPSLPEVEDWHMEPADVKVLGTVVRDAAYKIHDFERALTHALDVLQEEDEREFARTIGARGHKRQLSESRSEAGLDTRRARHENPRRDPRSRRRDDWSHHARSERSRRHMRLLRDDERGSRHSARGHRTSRHRSHRDGRDHGRRRDHRDRRQDPRDRLHERHRDHRSHREHRRHRGDREHRRHHRRDHDDDDYERTSRRSSRRTRRHSRDHDRERGNERHDGFSGSTGHTTSLPDLGAGRSHDGTRGAGAGPTSVVHSRPSSTAGSVAGSVTSARSHYGTFYDEQRAHNWQRNYYSSHTLQSQNAAAVAAMRYRRAQLATSGSSTPGMGMSPSPYSALPPRHAGSGSSLDSVPHVVEVSMLNGEVESPVPNPYASGTPGTVASVTGTPSPGLASGTPSRRGSRVRRGSGERAAL